MAYIDAVAIQVSFASVGAGTSEVWDTMIPYSGTFRLDKAYFMPMTNRTAHATNNTDISMELDTNEVASEVTSVADTGNLTAGTPLELVLTASGKTLEVAGRTGRISFKKTDAGTGLALDGTFVAEFVRIR